MTEKKKIITLKINHTMENRIIYKLIFFGLIISAVVIEVVADILFKKWALANKNILLITGVFLYLAGTMFFAISLKYEFLSKAVPVFAILNIILVTFVGLIIFKEDLSLINKVGIALGILGVALIEI